MYKASLGVALLYFLGSIATAKMGTRVIYGDDGRREFFQVERADMREVADSTAAMVQNSNLKAKADGTTEIKADSFKNYYGLCASEPFKDQPAGAICSGFLVGPDLVATAGHCVADYNCATRSFVFSYRMGPNGEAPYSVDSSEVYACKQVVARELTNQQDYALVRVDRPVTGHRVLTLAQKSVAAGDQIFVVGHPAGIPTKVADMAQVRTVEQGYFTSNLDTYGGNSGSAVFSQDSMEVVGILVRGETDFAYDKKNQCMKSNVCNYDGCRGEDVTSINYINEALKKFQ